LNLGEEVNHDSPAAAERQLEGLATKERKERKENSSLYVIFAFLCGHPKVLSACEYFAGPQ
jgi:hypothetical protein